MKYQEFKSKLNELDAKRENLYAKLPADLTAIEFQIWKLTDEISKLFEKFSLEREY